MSKITEYEDTTIDSDPQQQDDYDEPEVEKPVVDTKKHYVDATKLMSEYIKYKADRQVALDNGAEHYPIPRYLADSILKVATHLAYRYNFIGYSFRSDMISDGVLACVKGFDTFDPERSQFIFSWLTQICFYAFVKRIQKEATETEIKGKLIMEMDIDSIITQESQSGDYDATFISYMKEAQDFKVRVEPPKEEKIVPKSTKFVELDFDE